MQTMSDRFRLAICVLALLTCGCSNRQVYGTGQGWQLNQCQKILDDFERARCMEGANVPYDKYEKEREEAKKQPR
jgi:predicted metal-binding protein